MRHLLAVCSLFLALAGAAAADDGGCCQFFTPSAGAGPHSRGTRQCANLTRQDCTLVRAPSTFLRGFQCNAQTARCVLGPPTVAPIATATPTPTATAARIGCCQLDAPRRGHSPVCGNQVSEASCLKDFDGQPSFCADCVCSSHAGAGFDFSSGQCVARTPTPTATPSDPRGCCQLDNLRGTRSTVCGNAITRSSCMNDFDGQPSFCADCVCSSHTTDGFDLAAPGACRAPLPPGRKPGHSQPVRRPVHSQLP